MTHSRRRVLTAACAAAWPACALRAQPGGRAIRIGVVTVWPDPQGWRARSPAAAIVPMLAQHGFVEGRNLELDFVSVPNYSDAHLDQATTALVQRKPDVLLGTTVPVSLAMKRATRDIPIVAWATHGAVETGLVDNLRRPGGNITGTETLAPEMDAKRLELFKQLLPQLEHLAVLTDDVDKGIPIHLEYIRRAGARLGLKSVGELQLRVPADIDTLMAQAPGPAGGLTLVSTNKTYVAAKRVMELAQARSLPTLCEFRELAALGCLMSYGATFQEISERTAAQIAKILRGTPPGELPVEQPTRFELVINLKTARALGITVPRDLLLRADAVIE